MLLVGDCREVLRKLDANSVDACVTDPPYGLKFMGKAWDHEVPGADIWREVLRVLKPGGHLLSFFGTRTYHRGVVQIEDAGFEIRDQIGWVYGSGFPKSQNQKDEWEGWGTALKPAWEPICMARKPLIGTVKANLAAHGVGAVNIDGCRVPSDGRPLLEGDYKKTADNVYAGRQDGSLMGGSKAVGTTEEGRWPANLIHDGSEEVLEGFPQAPGQIADASYSSDKRKTQNVYGAMKRGSAEASAYRLCTDKGGTNFAALPGARRGDSGSAARFFYCAKASKSDRNDGLEHLPDSVLARSCQEQAEAKRGNTVEAEGGAFNKARIVKNNHPTVKPTELMRYLCRLVTPPGGTVLDPFMGSGSTGRGAVLEGFSFIGIELEQPYADIAQARIDAVQWRELADLL